MFTQHFIVEGRGLGTAPRSIMPRFDTVVEPDSYAFFCPCCADLWARCPVVNDKSGKVRPFVVWRIACRKCDTPASRVYLHISGSLFLSWDKTFNEGFPPDVIRREFDIHMQSVFNEAAAKT